MLTAASASRTAASRSRSRRPPATSTSGRSSVAAASAACSVAGSGECEVPPPSAAGSRGSCCSGRCAQPAEEPEVLDQRQVGQASRGRGEFRDADKPRRPVSSGVTPMKNTQPLLASAVRSEAPCTRRQRDQRARHAVQQHRTGRAARLVVQNGLGYDDWATTIEKAAPGDGRTVISVQQLLALPGRTLNPCLWHDPATMPKVAGAVAAAWAAIDPAHASYYRANAVAFTASMGAWTKALAAFKAAHPGTHVATGLAAAPGRRPRWRTARGQMGPGRRRSRPHPPRGHQQRRLRGMQALPPRPRAPAAPPGTTQGQYALGA
jgi:hypothetical protein